MTGRRELYVLMALFLVLGFRMEMGPPAEMSDPPELSERQSAPPQPLSAEGKSSLRSIIEAGNLPDLRWPNFSDYRGHVAKFYQSYGDTLPWVQGMQPTPQAQAIIALLQKADQKGLSPDDYDGPRWNGRLAKLSPAIPNPAEPDALRFDIALTVATMRYISDLHVGKVNPRHLAFGLEIEHKKYNLPEFLKEDVAGAPDVSNALSHIEPSYPGYVRTIQALQTYMELARRGDGEPLPTVTKIIAPGDSYPGTQQLLQRLRLLGDLPAKAMIPDGDTVYQGSLVDAVKSFQLRHGLTADGRIGAQTVAQMNIALGQRVRQMQLTLERWRWLPVAFEQAPIVVNIPEFRLRAYDDQMRMALSMNVVVGKAYKHSTPVFTEKMQYLVFRPYWNVPPSIARGELLPAVQRDSNYLAKKGFDVVDARQNVVGSETVTPEMIQQIRAGKLYIRQQPGPKNALGLVKFIFPNDYSIYMHDTPATEFFSRSRRDFSHGCIRLEKPAELAAWVLRGTPGWTMERIRAAMNQDKPQQVNLAKPIPVLILYGTVIVSEDGIVHFYDDIYGHDVALEKVLAKGYPYPT
ncbi:MAG TPA: L,D-transpeptidase family protein [Candidatus Saccharimonadales bacterium]|jgi:murein L,D-transpeptidase YcbB/YkuD|nr:L,D-transpeptidase family protein [Candidatus Saccharimonadales bacterium]